MLRERALWDPTIKGDKSNHKTRVETRVRIERKMMETTQKHMPTR
jgi:hypothetical protein